MFIIQIMFKNWEDNTFTLNVFNVNRWTNFKMVPQVQKIIRSQVRDCYWPICAFSFCCHPGSWNRTGLSHRSLVQLAAKVEDSSCTWAMEAGSTGVKDRNTTWCYFQYGVQPNKNEPVKTYHTRHNKTSQHYVHCPPKLLNDQTIDESYHLWGNVISKPH